MQYKLTFIMRFWLLLIVFASLHWIASAEVVLLPRGAGTEWRYLDDGSAPNERWVTSRFDDSSWKKGAAPLGYGAGSLGTILSFGGIEENKHITTFFRNSFTIDAASKEKFEAVGISLRRDDGAAVYLNGKEVIRSNLPSGKLGADQPATRAIDREEEGQYLSFVIPTNLLSEDGFNIVATEVHQAYPASSDLFFDMEITGYFSGESPEVKHRATEGVKIDSLDVQQALLLIEGKEKVGSGFVAEFNGKKNWVTNAHVLSGVEQFSIKTLKGNRLEATGFAVSVEADIARGPFKGECQALKIMEDLEKKVSIGDRVYVYGNSDGRGVVTKLEGSVNGIGPHRIEVDAEFISGNSGSPIIHAKSGEVIGIATYLTYPNLDRIKEDAKKGLEGALTGELGRKVRRFGYRLDNGAGKWQTPKWSEFVKEARAIQKMDGRTVEIELLAMSGIRYSRYKPGGNYFVEIPRDHRLETLCKMFNKNPANRKEASVQAYIMHLENYVRSMKNETWHEFRTAKASDFTAYHAKEFEMQKSYRQYLYDFYDRWLINKFGD